MNHSYRRKLVSFLFRDYNFYAHYMRSLLLQAELTVYKRARVRVQGADAEGGTEEVGVVSAELELAAVGGRGTEALVVM